MTMSVMMKIFNSVSAQSVITLHIFVKHFSPVSVNSYLVLYIISMNVI